VISVTLVMNVIYITSLQSVINIKLHNVINVISYNYDECHITDGCGVCHITD